MIAYGSDVPFKLAAIRFLAANSSTWNIGETLVKYEFLKYLLHALKIPTHVNIMNYIGKS